MSASSNSRRDELFEQIIKAATAGGIIAFIYWALSGLFTTQLATVLTVALAIFVVAGAIGNLGEVSIPFAVSLLAVGSLLTMVLPDVLVDPWAQPILAGVGSLGVPVTTFDPVRLTVVTVFGLLVYYIVDTRLLSGIYNERPSAKKPRTVAQRVSSSIERLLNEYLSIGRVIVIFFLSASVILFGNVALIAAQVTEFFGQAPVISGYLATLAGGFARYVYEVPVIGGVDPVTFWFAAGAIFVLAVGVKYQ